MGQDNVDDRITKALKTLRNEMVDLRRQDVQLMKQLLNINKTIQNLSKDSRTTNGIMSCKPIRSISSCNLQIVASNQTNRQQYHRSFSVPVFEETMGSSFSLEGSEDLATFSESEEDVSFTCGSPPKLSRMPSLPVIKDTESDVCDEDLLKTNIKVWKLSQPSSNA